MERSKFTACVAAATNNNEIVDETCDLKINYIYYQISRNMYFNNNIISSRYFFFSLERILTYKKLIKKDVWNKIKYKMEGHSNIDFS